MLAKRIIAALDVREGRVVKGTQFENIKDAGDPVALGAHYSAQGIDELVFLDINASHEGRETLRGLAARIARELSIPFTVGGGIRSAEDVRAVLEAGADKVFINSSALLNPALIDELAKEFGSQCILVAIDAKCVDGRWQVFRSGGRVATDYELLPWAAEVTARGAGEILFTSMNHDGAKAGFAVDTLATLAATLPVPIIASGGAGTKEHFHEVFAKGGVDAALAASVFHFGEINVAELKKYLAQQGIAVRCVE